MTTNCINLITSMKRSTIGLCLLLWISFAFASSPQIRGELYLQSKTASNSQPVMLPSEQDLKSKLYFDWRIQPWLQWHTLLIYVQKPLPYYPRLGFDELNITLGQQNTLLIGKTWLPFGHYANATIVKPITKALGHVRHYTLLFTSKPWHHWYSQWFIFKAFSPADNDVGGGMSLVYQWANAKFGTSIINNLGESMLLQYDKGFGGFRKQHLNYTVPALANYIDWRWQHWQLHLTQVMALKAFSPQDLSYANHGAKPRAQSLQLIRHFSLCHRAAALIFIYDQSQQTAALSFPKQRIGAGFNLQLQRQLLLQLEYYHDRFDETPAGGNNLGHFVNVKASHSHANSIFAQLLVSFY